VVLPLLQSDALTAILFFRAMFLVMRNCLFPGELLVSKSAILRLLAELVRSYPICSALVANHHYKADPDTLVKQV